MSAINFNLTVQNFTERAKILQEIQAQCTRAEKGEHVDLKQSAKKLAVLVKQLHKDGEAIHAGIKITPEIRKEYDLHKKDVTGLNARVKALSAKANLPSAWVKPVVYTALTIGVIAFSAFIIKTGILSLRPTPQPPPAPRPSPTPSFSQPVCNPKNNPFISDFDLLQSQTPISQSAPTPIPSTTPAALIPASVLPTSSPSTTPATLIPASVLPTSSPSTTPATLIPTSGPLTSTTSTTPIGAINGWLLKPVVDYVQANPLALAGVVVAGGGLRNRFGLSDSFVFGVMDSGLNIATYLPILNFVGTTIYNTPDEGYCNGLIKAGAGYVQANPILTAAGVIAAGVSKYQGHRSLLAIDAGLEIATFLHILYDVGKTIYNSCTADEGYCNGLLKVGERYVQAHPIATAAITVVGIELRDGIRSRSAIKDGLRVAILMQALISVFKTIYNSCAVDEGYCNGLIKVGASFVQAKPIFMAGVGFGGGILNGLDDSDAMDVGLTIATYPRILNFVGTTIYNTADEGYCNGLIKAGTGYLQANPISTAVGVVGAGILKYQGHRSLLAIDAGLQTATFLHILYDVGKTIYNSCTADEGYCNGMIKSGAGFVPANLISIAVGTVVGGIDLVNGLSSRLAMEDGLHAATCLAVLNFVGKTIYNSFTAAYNSFTAKETYYNGLIQVGADYVQANSIPTAAGVLAVGHALRSGYSSRFAIGDGLRVASLMHVLNHFGRRFVIA